MKKASIFIGTALAAGALVLTGVSAANADTIRADSGVTTVLAGNGSHAGSHAGSKKGTGTGKNAGTKKGTNNTGTHRNKGTNTPAALAA